MKKVFQRLSKSETATQFSRSELIKWINMTFKVIFQNPDHF